MKDVLPVVAIREQHSFVMKDYVGGNPVLDFINTVTGRNGRPRDWLNNYESVLAWAEVGSILDKNRIEWLRHLALQDATAAEVAFCRLIDLRETLFSMVLHMATGQVAPAPGVATVEQIWREAAQHMSLVRTADGRIHAQLDVESCRLRWFEFTMAWGIVPFMENVELATLRQCAGENCGWLFCDTSKAGRRRWCDMSTCGNAAKTRRHSVRRNRATTQ